MQRFIDRLVHRMDNDKLAGLFSDIIKDIGEDVTREGLLDTTQRAAKAFRFLNNGYDKNLD